MTTPIYIVDAGEDIETNATVKIRVGEWRKATTPYMYFDRTLGFVVLPTPGTTFEETGQTLDDLITENVDAVVYVDYLRCDPAKVSSLYCGNGKKECDEPFREQLISNEGMIMGDISALQPVMENESSASILDSPTVRKLYGVGYLSQNSGKRFRDIQVIGKFSGGDTLVWDREPGIMRVGAIWGAAAKSEQTLELIPANMKVQPGKTYYLRYSINLGERWKLTKVE